MEGILYYIWKHKLLPKENLYTTDAEPIHVIHYGNEDGKNFCDARIRIGENEWYGNIAIHDEKSDYKEENSEYHCNIILHITTGNTYNKLGKHDKNIPCLCIKLPNGLKEEFDNAENKIKCIACDTALKNIGELNISSTLSRLLIERIEDKASRIQQYFSECNGRWDDTLFKTIIRSFGFGIQSQVFEKWAKILDMNALGKHRDNPIQIEAIMFGQAGLLDEESIPQYYRANALQSDYYINICREYKFLKNKFSLRNIDYKEWRSGSGATPHVRIARIAALYVSHRTDIAHISACNTQNEYRALIDTTLSGYWSNHTCFGGTETVGNGSMKQRQIDIIIINALAPTLYIYGKHRNDNTACSKAEDLLHQLKEEDNGVIRKWREKGITVQCAADSQAILQLENKYCRMKECTKCNFTYYYIKEKLAAIYNPHT